MLRPMRRSSRPWCWSLPCPHPPLRPRRRPGAPIFFYPWYSNLRHDGQYVHWTQGGHTPPFDIASAFFPMRGAYSSDDPHVLGAQMRDIAASGVDEVVSSWWGRGSPEDQRLPAVMRAAKRRGLQVAVQLEPYPGRTIDSIAADLVYIRSLGIRDVYIYRTDGLHGGGMEPRHASADGAAAVRTDRTSCGFAARAGFAGFYTYDIVIYDAAKFDRYCRQARALRDPLCAVGRSRLRRAGGDRRYARQRPPVRRDATTRCGMRRFARAPTSSRSRRTTSGAKGRRSSPPATVAVRELRRRLRVARHAPRSARTSRAPRTGRHASRKTSAPQPATSASNTSSTPRNEGCERSTSTSSHSSSPSEPAPSSAPKQSSVSVEMTLRRPVWRRAIPSSSRSSSSGSMRTLESEPMQIPMPRVRTRSTGRKPSPRSASVVRHAQIRAPAAREQVELGSVGVRRVDDRRSLREAPGPLEQLDRPDAVLGEALLDLARLFVRVHVQRQPLGGGVAADLLEPVLGTCAHGVGGDADGDPAAAQILQLAHVLRRPTPGESGAGRRVRRRRATARS